MKKQLCIFLLLTAICGHLHSQRFYFPRAQITDSVSLRKNMAELARSVLKHYRFINGTEAYYNNLFRAQLVAGYYDLAITSIENYRKTDRRFNALGPYAYLQYELFAKAMLDLPKPFEQSFTRDFSRAFRMMNDRLAFNTAKIFRGDAALYQQQFCSALAELPAEDSLSFRDALRLCRIFSACIAYERILPVSLTLVQDEEEKRYRFQDSVYITTKDGTKLRAYIVLPGGTEQKKPVALLYTPVLSAGIGDAMDAASFGYAGVVVFGRGAHSPTGSLPRIDQDADDIYQVIDWISRQPWCNGKVGMYGSQLAGYEQWVALTKVHPMLKTVVPQSPVVPGLVFPMENNVHNNLPLPVAGLTKANTGLQETLFEEWYRTGRSVRALDTMAGYQAGRLQHWLTHPDYDSYWQSFVPSGREFAAINIPILSITGFYDTDQTGTLFYFKKQYLNNKGARHYLVIGSFADAVNAATLTPDRPANATDTVADPGMHDLAFEWLDFIIRKKKIPVPLKEGKVAIQAMGTYEWRTTGSLTRTTNDSLTFYLSAEQQGNYLSLTNRGNANNGIEQEIDFADRSSRNDYRPLKLFNDQLDTGRGLVFATEPMKDSFLISGQFSGELIAIINKKDMDPWISIYEWLPDGQYLYLARWLCRASYARDPSRRQLLKPGKEERIPINGSPVICRMIRPGSRLVFVLNVNKNPFDEINYGTGKDVSKEDISDSGAPLRVRWRTDSFIRIPVYH